MVSSATPFDKVKAAQAGYYAGVAGGRSEPVACLAFGEISAGRPPDAVAELEDDWRIGYAVGQRRRRSEPAQSMTNL